jgi:hypothetical protein
MFFVFVVHAGRRDEQPGPEGARGKGEIGNQEHSSADGDHRGRTVHASPDNVPGSAGYVVHASQDSARGSAGYVVHASQDNGGTRTASFYSPGWLPPPQ